MFKLQIRIAVYLAELGSNLIPALTGLDVVQLMRVGNKQENYQTQRPNRNQGPNPGLTSFLYQRPYRDRPTANQIKRGTDVRIERQARHVEDQTQNQQYADDLNAPCMLLLFGYCCYVIIVVRGWGCWGFP